MAPRSAASVSPSRTAFVSSADQSAPNARQTGMTAATANRPAGPQFTANSKDPESFGRVAKIFIDPKANEGYVADGYLNHRVAVIDLDTGKTVWSEKLGPDQLHASPAYADGKFYVPMHNGTVHVIKDAGDKAQVLSVNKMDSLCLGAPSFYGDSVFIFTKESLNCFGPKATAPSIPPSVAVAPEAVSTAAITQLQIVPAEFALSPGQSRKFTVWGLDATGRRVDQHALALLQAGESIQRVIGREEDHRGQYCYEFQDILLH